MFVRKVNTVGELLEAVPEAAKELKGGELWFRGHADSDWHLNAKIDREFERCSESDLVTAFISQAPSRYASCPDEGDAGSWMSLMQHHGLATRLLDWSASPLIGAFFAVRDPMEGHDAAIWALCAERLNLAMCKDPSILTLRHDFVQQQFACVKEPNLELRHEVLGLAPNEVHPRLMTQQSRFTIHSIVRPLECCPGHDSFLAKLVIPEGSREQIRTQLTGLGVTESTLFPDLDHLAQDLNRKYEKKNA